MAYGTAKVDNIQSSASNTPPVFKDSNGSQVGTLCRAFAQFNGGNGNTAGVINASFNVSSITVNGTGDYTVNFTTAMSDVNYSVSGSYLSVMAPTARGTTSIMPVSGGTNTGSIRIWTGYGSAVGYNGSYDNGTTVSIVIHR